MKSNVLVVDVIEVPSAETDEVIQAFTLERADRRFDKCVRIGRLHRRLHDANMGEEQPVVRPYFLVDDIQAVVKAAEAAGAEVLMPPTEIPNRGTFAIYYLGKIEHGLWQNP